MWNSVAVKRSLLQLSKTPAGNAAKNHPGGICCTWSHRSKSSSALLEPLGSKNKNNSILRFTMTPKPPPSAAAAAATTESTWNSESRHGSSQLDYSIPNANDDDHIDDWNIGSDSSVGFSTNASEDLGADPFFDRTTAAEQMTQLMENSYYYANFKARGSHEGFNT